MKSQVIKIRNLPEQEKKPKAVRVKPTELLLLCAAAGLAVAVTGSSAAPTGLVLCVSAMFALTMLPDKKLIEFTPDFLIMYNLRDNDSCMIIYWDEIVQWRYDYHQAHDELVVYLVDGSTQSQDLFGKYAILRQMNMYAAGKEIKSVR
ncbi:MAG: hypothetical protein K6D03_03390 [Solobacterium sp.]|nr:hypothetical protein [Solobacterium sp.]